MTSQSRPYTFDRVVRLLIGCAIFAFIIWLLDLLKDVLLPFCVACLIAYLFEPFVQYNRSLLRLKGETRPSSWPSLGHWCFLAYRFNCLL